MCGERERGRERGREGGRERERVHVVTHSCIIMYKYNHVMYNVQDLGKERIREGKECDYK